MFNSSFHSKTHIRQNWNINKIIGRLSIGGLKHIKTGKMKKTKQLNCDRNMYL